MKSSTKMLALASGFGNGLLEATCSGAGSAEKGCSPSLQEVGARCVAGKKKEEDKKPDLRFTTEEKLELMSTLEQIVPVSQVDWDAVENDFNFNFPHRERTAAGLCRFFNGCAKTKAPTGDPNIPVWVRKAKDIQEAIINRSDAAIDLDDDDMGSEGLASMMNRRPEQEVGGVARGVSRGADGGEDDDEEDYDYNFNKKPAAKPRGKNKAEETNTTAKAKRKNATKTEESNQILQAVLMSDKMNREAAEQRRLDEAARDKRNEQKELRCERKSDKRLELMLGLMTGVMSQHS